MAMRLWCFPALMLYHRKPGFTVKALKVNPVAFTADVEMRVRLPQETLPEGVRVVSVAGGCAVLRSGREWEARLTLVPKPALPPAPLPAAAAAAAPAAQNPAPAHAGGAAGAVGVKGEAGAGEAGAGFVRPSPAGASANGAAAPVEAAGAAAVSAAGSERGATENAVAAGLGGGGAGGEGAGVGSAGRGEAEAEAGAEDSAARWRWRPLEMRVLPDWAQSELLPPALMTRLQARLALHLVPECYIPLRRHGVLACCPPCCAHKPQVSKCDGEVQAEVEVRMWAAADEADRRCAAAPALDASAGTRPSAPAGEAPAAVGAGTRVKDEGAAAPALGGVEGAGGGAGRGAAEPAPQRPLAIMHGVLLEAAGRLALSEVRALDRLCCL